MDEMMMISLGGRHVDATIEVHDLQFVVAPAIEETFPLLEEIWYGQVDRLHVDTYKKLRGADGYAIELKDTPQEREVDLYLANVGGYVPAFFGEVHQVGLFVVESEKAAKKRALTDLLDGADLKHVDNVYTVQDKLVTLDGSTKYIHLTPTGDPYDLKPDWNGFMRLRK